MAKKRRGKIAFISVFFITVSVLVIAALQYKPSPPSLDIIKVTINNVTFKLYEPKTVREHEIGLAAYDTLGEDQGMIFRGLPEGTQSIWMKDMKFDIDVLWVNKDNQIIHIVQGMSRSSYPQTFHNPVNMPSSYVVELPAEATITHSITIGQTVEIRD